MAIPAAQPWWRKLWTRIRRGKIRGFLRKIAGRSLAQLPAAPEQSNSPLAEALPALPLDSHLEYLEALIVDVSEASRQEDIGDQTFWKHMDALCERGDQMLAAQWIEKFLQTERAGDKEETLLRERLVQLFKERGDLQPVLSHLKILAQSPPHASDAHFHLAEHYRSIGEEVMALREYEAVLALDMAYPNVRQRYQRLRDAHGGDPGASAGETMIGAGAGGMRDGSRYLLARELGRGAAGVVYLAQDTQLERAVAVKLLHPHLAATTQEKALQAFFDEARVAASLRHPNIVAILDLDEKARRIVMELCAGGTLRSVLRDRGPRPLRRVLEMHAQILSALQASHARGVIHRDLKPANLMFRQDPDLPGAEVVLGDFGIAHLPDEAGQTGKDRALKTQAVGTMAYMSPEQRRGQAIPASDLYASAVVLFEMLTGRYPWSRNVLLKGKRSPSDFTLPEELHAHQPKLGELLQTHINALGHPDASQRLETTEAMKEARHLRDFAMVQCAKGDPALA